MKLNLRKTIAAFPTLFQTRIIKLTGLILLLLILGFLILFSFSMPTTAIPLFACCLCLLFYLIRLYFLLAARRYIVIQGICIDVERKLLSKRRLRSISIDTSKGRVNIRKETKLSIYPGDKVLLYLLPNTPIYYQDGCMITTTFLGLDVLANDENQSTDRIPESNDSQ